jgi:hypothetical protein
MAELQAFLADHDSGPARELMGPLGYRCEGTARGAGDKAWVAGKVLVGTNINEDRAFGRANKASKFFRRDGAE